ncbi:MAG: HyaD/HybD family hydrogenase maturation endopeptidase [Wenzhouxiangellaceae bacterium]
MSTPRVSAPDRVLLLGVGNLLWADEGFGVRCIESFESSFDEHDAVDLVDGGTQGLYLVDLFRAYRRVIIFDAIDFGDLPGEIRIVEDDEIPAFVAGRKVSLHQAGLQDVIACAKMLGGCAEKMVLIGVQPAELEDYGGSLTPTVRARLGDAVAHAAGQLADWGVALLPRRDPRAGEAITPGLDIRNYERGRPSEKVACRVGDGRVLNQRAWRQDDR